MSFYLVFGSTKRPKGFMGGTYLDWGNPPIGVYEAATPEDACRQAAADSGTFGTYFAIDGFPWGIELMHSGARQLGRREPLEERLHAALDKLEQTDRAIEQFTGRHE